MYLRYTTARRRKVHRTGRWCAACAWVGADHKPWRNWQLDEHGRLEGAGLALARHLIGEPEQAGLFDDGRST